MELFTRELEKRENLWGGGEKKDQGKRVGVIYDAAARKSALLNRDKEKVIRENVKGEKVRDAGPNCREL